MGLSFVIFSTFSPSILNMLVSSPLSPLDNKQQIILSQTSFLAYLPP
jgi:hypothetical protein